MTDTANAPTPKPWIHAISPYKPGRSTGDDGRKLHKLSSNENPLGTSPLARDAFAAAAAELEIYPDGAAIALREAIGAHYGLDPERIIHGTGSDEVLHLATGAFAGWAMRCCTCATVSRSIRSRRGASARCRSRRPTAITRPTSTNCSRP
jgi:histidinol-phosphate/aromatic aminotransferase/cobyric acid decarboxylase-like protein